MTRRFGFGRKKESLKSRGGSENRLLEIQFAGISSIRPENTAKVFSFVNSTSRLASEPCRPPVPALPAKHHAPERGLCVVVVVPV